MYQVCLTLCLTLYSAVLTGCVCVGHTARGAGKVAQHGAAALPGQAHVGVLAPGPRGQAHRPQGQEVPDQARVRRAQPRPGLRRGSGRSLNHK